MDVIRKIFVPTDFSPCSQEAVAYAAFLAAKFGAAIVLAHILEPVVDPIALPAHAFSEGDLKKTDQGLECVARLWRERGIQIETSLFRGRPETEIVGKAEEMECDLIVMGTHGRTGVVHLIKGSVSEQVIRTSPIPVLTLREQDKKEVVIPATGQPVIGLSPEEGTVS